MAHDLERKVEVFAALADLDPEHARLGPTFAAMSERIRDRKAHESPEAAALAFLHEMDAIREATGVILARMAPSLAAEVGQPVPEVMVDVEDGQADVRAVCGTLAVRLVHYDLPPAALSADTIESALAPRLYTGSGEDMQCAVQAARSVLKRRHSPAKAARMVSPGRTPRPSP